MTVAYSMGGVIEKLSGASTLLQHSPVREVGVALGELTNPALRQQFVDVITGGGYNLSCFPSGADDRLAVARSQIARLPLRARRSR